MSSVPLGDLVSESPVKQALLAIEDMRRRMDAAEGYRRDPIAIVGMACRFPGGADSPTAFWQMLVEGKDGVGEIPPERWSTDDYYDPDPNAPGAISTRWGGFLNGIDRFDASFFGISPREAAAMDPQQRLFLEVAWEALEDAGLDVDRLAGSATGVFTGVCASDYERLQYRDPRAIDIYSGTGSVPNIVPGRLSFLLDLRGPSVAVDTACSSSLLAAHLACQSLRSGESTLALAGGVNLLLLPERHICASRMQMLAADGRCKTFDSRADGFVRSEGCGVVVLKRLSDARADGDEVLAVIRGSAANHDGRSAGLTAPNQLAQEAVIRSALSNAEVGPGSVGYVEAHGAGTALGDPIEVSALRSVYAADTSAGTCALGAVKTVFGHMEGAAGIAGLMKSALVLRNRVIPPVVHFNSLNPSIELAGTRLTIPVEAHDWEGGHARRAAVSSFGWSGTNVHMVLEEAPDEDPDQRRGVKAGPREWYVFPLSARSDVALRDLAGACVHEWTANVEGPSIAALCRSAARRRSHHKHRVAVVASSIHDLVEALSAFADGAAHPSVATRVGSGSDLPPRLAFICPAAEAPSPPAVRELGRYAPFSTKHEECTHLPLAAEAFAFHVALAALWREWGVTPDAVVGAGTGRASASHIARVLSLEDAARAAWATGDRQEEGTVEVISSGSDLRSDGGPSRLTDILILGGIDEVADPIMEALRAEGYAGNVLACVGDDDCGHALMNGLAALYASGHRIAWEAIYPGRASVVALPRYPWQRERYWLELPLNESPAAPAPRSALGQPVDLAAPLDGRYWEVDLRSSTAYADEHRVKGQHVVPAGVHVALALLAAQEVLGTSSVSVERVMIERPLVLAPHQTCRVQTFATGSEVRLFARPAGARTRDWSAHLRCGFARARATPETSIDALRSEMPEEFDPDELYDRLASRGVEHGPSLRRIDRLWLGNGTALAHIAGPEARVSESPWPMVDPAVLDASFQPLAALAPEAAGTLLPTSVEAITFHRPPGADVWAHVTRRDTGDDGCTADVTLLDEAGRVCIEVLGLAARPLRKPPVRSGESAPILVTRWETAADAAREPAGSGQWLILADTGGVADRVARELHSRGERYTILRQSDDAQRYEQVLATTNGEVRGVVFLEALDAVETEAAREVMDAQLGVCMSTVRLLRAVARCGQSKQPRLWLVTRGAQRVDVDDSVRVVQAPLWGLAAVIAHEHPGLHCTRVDLDPQGETNDGEALVAELLADRPEDQLALRGGRIRSPRLAPATVTSTIPAFDPDGAYLVTGGLGGIGLAVAQWLVEHGARHLRLASRTEPSPNVARIINQLQNAGAGIQVLRADVADPVQAARMIETSPGAPALLGIFHAAGVLDDATLLTLTADRLERVLAPKLAGAWNLHRLTRDLDLAAFVLFSSAASLIGTPGQANYAAANAFLDALAHHRSVSGLAALSISWGPWDKVGLAAEKGLIGKLTGEGLAPISPDAALDALGVLLGGAHAHAAVMRFDLRRWHEAHPGAEHHSLFAQLPSETPAAMAHGEVREHLEHAPAGQRERLLETHLRELISTVLRVPADGLDRQSPLGKVGLDSLTSLELRNRIEDDLGLRLPLTLMWNYESIAALSSRLLTTMGLASEAAATEGKARASLELSDLVDEIEAMSDADARRELDDLREPPDGSA